MANSFAVSRSHLIYGVCLPVAVLIGYLMAEPESGSWAVVVLVMCILSIPLLMRWHHPLLVFSCNAMILPYFIPGRPELWMVMTVISLFFSVLNRSVGQDLQFFNVRSVSYSLVFFAAVVVGTAWWTGGVGLAAFGSSSIGGKKYVNVLIGAALYFALAAVQVKPGRAQLYMVLFLLSGLTGLASYLAVIGGKPFYFLVEFFPIEGTLHETTYSNSVAGPEAIDRLGTLTAPAMGIFCLLLARYGARGVMDLKKPWRLLLLLFVTAISTFGGFRSGLILFILIFAAVFYLEGLLHTRYALVILMSGLLAGAILLPNVRNLPYSVQRTLCFLPLLNVDPMVRMDADGSSNWRLQIWERVIKDVPKYLIKGKGYGMSPEELMMLQAAGTDYAPVLTQEGAVLSGDYHNGPLSLIIPFGIFGVIGFFWFLAASLKVLYKNYLHGDPSILNINRFLLSYFVVKVIFFMTVFGGLSGDMAVFAGLIGLSVSLNGGVCRAPEPQSLPEMALDEPMSAEVG